MTQTRSRSVGVASESVCHLNKYTLFGVARFKTSPDTLAVLIAGLPLML